MNILDRIKKWLFKEEKNCLINIGDIIQIPGRSYYNNSPEKLLEIDIYKEEYLKILSKKKIISSTQISFDNLEKEFLMHIDLILNLFMNKEQNIEFTKESYFKEQITMLKLQLYFNEINDMENETIEKLIALEELLKGKRVPIINRRVLTDKINSLKMIILTFRNQKAAISIEIKNYCIALNNKSSSYQIEPDYITQKYEEVHDSATSYIKSDTITYIDSLKVNYPAKIALLEKELEIYAYTHKKDVEAINDDLKEIKNKQITPDKKEELLKELSQIEKKYYLFEHYGRGSIKNEYLYDLYELKFAILTCNIMEEKETIKYDSQERLYYEGIIFKKLEKILKGENGIVSDEYGDKTKKAITEISSYLKDSSNYLSNILNDQRKLSLLLAFDSVHGIRFFFNQSMISLEEATKAFKATYDTRCYEFAKEIPLDTCFQVAEANEIYKTGYHSSHPLYRLFKMTKNVNYFEVEGFCDIYYLPQGLEAIDGVHFSNADPLYNYIGAKSAYNHVKLPKNLKYISGDLFFGDNVSTVEYYNGLRVIEGKALYSVKNMQVLNIWPSIEYISLDGVPFKKIRIIQFIDYKNSSLLHNKENLLSLFRALFYIRTAGEQDEYHKVTDGVYRKSITIEITSRFNSFDFFDDKGNKKASLPAYMLHFFKTIFVNDLKTSKYQYPFPFRDDVITIEVSKGKYAHIILKDEDLEIVLEKFIALIKDRLGYTLEFDQPKEETHLKKIYTCQKR